MNDQIKYKIHPNALIDSTPYLEFMDNLKYKKIIDLEQYKILNCNEKKEYLINNNIFIIHRCYQSFNGELLQNDNFSEFSNFFNYNNNYYQLNEIIENEFYDYLYQNIEVISILSDDPLRVFRSIDFKLNYLLNIEQKLLFLQKEYEENFKIFLSFTHFHPEGRNDNPYMKDGSGMTEYWKYFITEHFEAELFEYFTTGNVKFPKKDPSKNEDIGIIEHWSNMFISKKTMDYCKALIDHFEENRNNNIIKNFPSKKPSNINQNQYFSRVFKTEEAENILHETLKEFNVINKDDLADSGFQVICSSFWKVANYITPKQYIFKENVKKSFFIDHLNEKYKAYIKETSKGSLSYNEENNYKVEIFIKPYLKEQK